MSATFEAESGPNTTVLLAGTNRSGAKSPGALVVVLEEVGVDVEITEQHLRHGLVAAFGEPRAAEVAAAQVDPRRSDHPDAP